MAEPVGLIDLVNEEHTPEVFLATLKDYAIAGKAISAVTVKRAINKISLSKMHLREAEAYLIIGEAFRSRNTGDIEKLEAHEYFEARRYVTNRLRRMKE